MPTQTTVNGKLYTEYSPQELAKLKLEREIEAMLRSGRTHRPHRSVFEETHTTNPTYKKTPTRQ